MKRKLLCSALFLAIILTGCDKITKVVGVANSGDKVNLDAQLPIVVDFKGMDIPFEVPLLINHENTVFTRVGFAYPKLRRGKLIFKGYLFATAKRTLKYLKNGPYQVSIGFEVLEYKVAPANTWVNGIQFEEPIIIVTKSALREISIVAVGADPNTEVRIDED